MDKKQLLKMEKEKEFKIFLEDRCAYLTSEYDGAKKKVDIKCYCGHILSATPVNIKKRDRDSVKIMCKECKKRSDSFDEDTYIEKCKEIGMTLMSIDLSKKDAGHAGVIHSCGCRGTITVGGLKKKFQQKNGLCKSCKIRDVREGVFKRGFLQSLPDDHPYLNIVLTEVSKENYSVTWECGHKSSITFGKLRDRVKKGIKPLCPSCIKKMNNKIKSEKAISDAVAFFKSKGCEVLQTPDKSTGKYSLLGTCGHEFTIGYYAAKNRKESNDMVCGHCYASEAQKKVSDSEIRSLVEDTPIDFISRTDSWFKVSFSCGHVGDISSSTLRRHLESDNYLCETCKSATKKTKQADKLNELVKAGGAKLISIDGERATVEGACKHTFSATKSNIKYKMRNFQRILCPECSAVSSYSDETKSSEKKELQSFIRSLGVYSENNFRPNYPSGYEIDCFCPDKSIGFELDEIYWHSELKGKGRSYHINKTKSFSNIGIQVVHITDVEWNDKRLISQSLIASKLGKSPLVFNARSCKIKKVSAEDAKKFFKDNHMQGGVGCSSNTYGLFIDSQPVSMMSFKAKRNGSKCEIELYRFANALFTNVRGSFSKLFSHFVKNNPNVKCIISYADLRFSNINSEKSVYTKNGFVFTHISQPNYKYFRDSKVLFSRESFQKHKLKEKLNSFDENKSEWENMKDNGYNRVFDCGNAIYIWDREG